jgi:DNA-binding Lrp family transcriptional regulator
MPYALSDTDIIVLRSILKDGRKSFRQTSRKTGISTPTVKSKYDRLVHIGFIKSVSPILDFEKVTYSNPTELNNIKGESHVEIEEVDADKIRKGIAVQLRCNYCRDYIAGKTHILKFANFERFFCCTGCKSSYKKKYYHKINALDKKHINIQYEIY